MAAARNRIPREVFFHEGFNREYFSVRLKSSSSPSCWAGACFVIVALSCLAVITVTLDFEDVQLATDAMRQVQKAGANGPAPLSRPLNALQLSVEAQQIIRGAERLHDH